VLLREVEPSDLPVFFEHQADPEAVRMAAFPSRDRPAFDAHWARVLADGTVVARTILAGGRVAGNIVCFGPPEAREIGYWIGRAFWGRGIATGAVAAFLEVVPHRPLFGHVARHNAVSIRVLEKCGFRAVSEPPAGHGMDEIVLRMG